MLDGLGFTVAAEASSVTEALAAANEVRPDVALVDVWLPDGDGLTVARELSALPWQPRVVLTSSDSDAVSESDVRRSGAVAFVPKARLPDATLPRLLGSD